MVTKKYQFFKQILDKNDTKIIVLGSDVNVNDTKSSELAEDLLSLMITARFRLAKNRKQQQRKNDNKNNNDNGKKIKTLINNQDDVRGRVISLDPRVRMFMTGYDPNGQLIEWSNSDIDKVYKLSKKYDKLQSDKDLALGKINKRKQF
ncbi:hypothetical protein C2G38_2220575 [Gigaspora rosea]|uniref:Uncharacterized protein n=1 Tax=Gigaspora rosea TaxID=44941 RepID=A0A397U7Q4_9GLOM|nr:hypothetical protein C2G38_2220575 [Gigaspora rosea]